MTITTFIVDDILIYIYRIDTKRYLIKLIALFCIICSVYTIFTILNVVIYREVNFMYLFQNQSNNTLPSSASGNNYNVDWNCSEDYASTQAKKYQQLLSENRDWTSCYANDYISKLYLADFNISEQQNKLFFDVGANKGYTIAAWLSVWKPQMGFNQRSLYDYLAQVLKINDCGVCLDCREKNQSNLPSSNYADNIIEIHAFEPVRTTYDALVQARTRFNISTLYIYQLAISHMNGTTDIVKCRVGEERCGMNLVGGELATEGTFRVETMTLDDFVEQKNITQKIDLLKIDTEGADPFVLRGAKKLLSQAKIRMLIFENHAVGEWQHVSLLSVIESLNNKSYICHMLGQTGMARLTDCWASVYNFKAWSNVLCVHRQEKRLQYFLNQLLINNM